MDNFIRSQNLLPEIMAANSLPALNEVTPRLYNGILSCALASFKPPSTPLKKSKSNPSSNRHPWFDDDCRAARELKMNALKSKTLSHDERRALQRQYQKVLQRADRTHREAERLRLLALLRSDPRKFARRLRPQASSPCQAPPDALQSHFASLFNPPQSSRPLDPSFPPSHTYANLSLPNDALPPNPFNFNSVCRAAKSLRAHTAPDRFGIRAEFLRALDFKPPPPSEPGSGPRPAHGGPTLFLHAVTSLFIRMFKHGFPALFSAAHIVPLFKKGERKDPANYRGIAIISILAKLYATALNQSLMSALEQHQTARAEAQSGFRPQRSTTEQIWSLQQVIDRARSAMPGGRLYCCFVDFSKAFDSVPRPLLWQTLRKLGVRAEYVDAISSYYANVDMCVRFDDGSYSDPFPSVLGVKQGCPLSPTLFGLFIDQLWSRLENSRITNLDKHHTSNLPCSLFYADDLVLIGFTPTELQRLLNELARFCKDTRMAVNLAKTQVVVFRPRRELQSPPQFKFRGQPVALVDSYRYLGFESRHGRRPISMACLSFCPPPSVPPTGSAIASTPSASATSRPPYSSSTCTSARSPCTPASSGSHSYLTPSAYPRTWSACSSASSSTSFTSRRPRPRDPSYGKQAAYPSSLPP